MDTRDKGRRLASGITAAVGIGSLAAAGVAAAVVYSATPSSASKTSPATASSVSLGGDLATAGPGPGSPGAAASGAGPGAAEPWQVLVQDLPTDRSQHIALDPGSAMATSSTQKRRWKHAGADVHHILDPRFGLPAEAVWKTVTVAAPTCLEANAFSTAGIVRGFAAVAWFRSAGVTARLVDQRGRIVTTGGWPAESNSVEVRASRG
ncbi:FAD:protein FMN transferase [Arthrobacter sp. H-02-3]|uniref:FAD:protein FMN transferase n=1 Tax=Arthrobacter sp. H-02-3 TaxID=2703675 RepID=UPI000DD252C3|nr:FAD:protein FMN transferase [Arthrobacter sp. H-02-3]PVZ53344.1 hypothetical protein C9424_18015 [Arthrobacter sp. H-02-3]